MPTLPDPASALTQDEARLAFSRVLDAEVSEEQIEAFLIGLTDRGETATEVAAAASALRERLIPINAPADAIDVCGTGGDGHHTLNISTAVSLVVAAAGVPVAKHGNRAASSKAGAADVLEALGLDMTRAGETAEASLRDIGICFLFAANHHPAMRRIQPIRQKIGRRTIFNLMGPLANPARVGRQLIGIARPGYVHLYAKAMAELGTDMSYIVSGDEGLDELSLAGGNEVAEVTRNGVHMMRLSAYDAGLSSRPTEDIRGGDVHHNAAALKRLLGGEQGAYRDAVLFNAAAAFRIANRASSLETGVELAADTLESGRADDLLDRWIAYS
jgi:anthranilate phosphoribosyltransferase